MTFDRSSIGIGLADLVGRMVFEHDEAATSQLAPDAIISLPISNTAVAEAHCKVATAGIRLVLTDNSPSSLMPGRD